MTCQGPCGRTGIKLNKAGLCQRCYMQEYRKFRKTRDPNYKPWVSKNKKRVSLSLSRPTMAALEALPDGVRSRVVDGILSAAFHGVVQIVDSSGRFIANVRGAREKNALLGVAPTGTLAGESAFERNEHNPSVLAALNAVLSGQTVTGLFAVSGSHWAARWTPLRNEPGAVKAALVLAFYVGDETIVCDPAPA